MDSKNTIVVPTENDENVSSSRSSANEQLEIADTIVIDSPDMAELANTALSDIHRASKELDKRKDSILGPMLEAVKATRALFAPAETALESAKTTLKRKIADWLTTAEKARIAAEAQAQIKRDAEVEKARAAAEDVLTRDGATPEQVEEALAELEATEVAPMQVFTPGPGDMGSNSSSKVFKVEVVDLPALLRYLANDLSSKTPKFDKTVDIKIGQLKKFGNATKGTVEIPGVKFIEERTVTARG